MWKLTKLALSVLITSLFFYPFPTTLFPSANTKTIFACVGLVIFIVEYARKQSGRFPKDIALLIASSLSISLASYMAMVWNETTDTAYAFYVVSAIVWCLSAYTMVWLLRKIDVQLSFNKLCDYIIIASVIQCMLAWIISRYPASKPFFASFYAGFYGLDEFADGRLYGIGCCFDTGGVRLAISLVLLASRLHAAIIAQKTKQVLMYAVAFVVIVAIGNMIARTTTAGAMLAIPCFIVCWWLKAGGIRKSDMRSICLLGAVLIAGIFILSYEYNHSETMRKDLRYAFEGFFSLVEQGEWNVQSNEMLKEHWQVLPETPRTWIIGDGLMGPTTDDPYYVGPTYQGYYKRIDAGYLRFIFYFGLVGLTIFSLFMIYACVCVMQRWREYTLELFLLLLLHFAVWIKVSTDLFFVFAMFLMLSLVLETSHPPQTKSPLKVSTNG